MIFHSIARATFIIIAMLDGLEGAQGFSKKPRTVATCRRKIRTSVHHQNVVNQDMNAPYVIYPDKKAWAWERASPKKSLSTVLDQKNPAPAWLLNIIELAHWVSFPIGFYIASFLFNNSSAIAEAGNWGGSTSQVFFIMLGILNQVFGGGMAVLMHVYEGWMVAPFKNLLVLPENPTNEQVDAVRVQNYNNAWLRAAAYQMLMSFQSLGLSLFTMGVFGVKPWTQSLVYGTALISLLGPKEPRLELTRKVDGEDRPVLPLSISLTVVLAVNVIIQLLACVKLFYPIFAQSDKLGTAIAVIASILPSTLQGAGGAIEGYFAESSFKQWQHLGAFIILLAGFLLLGNAFKQMVLVGSTPDVMLPSFLNMLDSL
eukprot:CAMPEP_0204643020 /NCGR_PEP_ID=MMETSP0718-20130828/356_1 /ASSEMBLY_ACC=CAM_ASM_000674 /TAXON_ID=230516 /ORGANISM="Chaetoceros curvisetus" /LENGTH=370 /DNA_ID=CAMNT_0051664049 /DNA_START=43 /DNA_END=1155 /DNA_ORIENTATION=+